MSYSSYETELLTKLLPVLQEKINQLDGLEQAEVKHFVNEIKLFINETAADDSFIRAAPAVRFSIEAADLLLSLVKGELSRKDAMLIKDKLSNLEFRIDDTFNGLEIPIREFGRALLGLVTALATALMAVLETVMRPWDDKPYSMTSYLANKTYYLFKSPLQPALDIIDNLCEQLLKDLSVLPDEEPEPEPFQLKLI